MRYLAAISGDVMDSPLMRISPASGCFQADEVLEQNALAAAARPHDDKNFAGLDLKINALEHFLAVKTLAQAAHLQADTGSWIVGRAVHFKKSG